MTKKSLKNVTWREVQAPTTWRPKKGDELIGYYAGQTKKNGKFGEYSVVTLLVPYKGAMMISGSMVVQLADSALLSVGDPIRICFLGKKDIGEDRQMKVFKLFVGEGDALAEDEIPERYKS